MIASWAGWPLFKATIETLPDSMLSWGRSQTPTPELAEVVSRAECPNLRATVVEEGVLIKIAVLSAMSLALMLVSTEQGLGYPFGASKARSAAREHGASTWLVDDNDREGRGDARDQVKAKRPSHGNVDKKNSYTKSPFSANEGPGRGEVDNADPGRRPRPSERPIDPGNPGGAQHTPER